MSKRTVEEYRDGKILRTFQVDVPASADNDDSLQSHLQAALAANAAYLLIANPSAAQQRTQLENLTRAIDALIRRDLGALDVVTDS